MSKLSDITNKAVRETAGGTQTGLGLKPVLAINAGGAATIKTTNPIQYMIDGLLFVKAALAAVALAVLANVQKYITGLTTFYVQPVSTTVYYLLVLDSAGTVSCIQGTYAGQSLIIPDTNMPTVGAGGVPDVDTSVYAPFGIIKVVTNGATTFTPGTTALDAAGLTVTYFDIAHIPSNATP